MLYVCSSLKKYQEFRDQFQKTHDLSKVPSSQLADECDSILAHHSKGFVFLGYLEPGWMLESSHQTRIRKLFRKFDVSLVCYFPESLPHSWKTEIHTFYVDSPQHGDSNSIHDGGALQDQSHV